MEPTQQPRIKFKMAQDWYNFLQSKQGRISGPELFELRKAYYAEIETLRLIAKALGVTVDSLLNGN